MFCEGQLLPISEYETLFNLIGTTYGGDGQSTFALPDLRGRVAVHVGTGYELGQAAGVETVTLTTSQIPSHNHVLTAATSAADSSDPTNGIPAAANYGGDPVKAYAAAGGAGAVMDPNTIGPFGGSQPHTNLQPFLAVSFIISLFGVFPSPT
jgi:microcystin-dependent protein